MAAYREEPAGLIWQEEFSKVISELFVQSGRTGDQQGYVLLYNINLSTLRGGSWNEFRRIWLDNYASDENDAKVKRILILVPLRTLSGEPRPVCHPWTDISALGQMCDVYTEHADKWLELKRLVGKTFIATISPEAKPFRRAPEQYAFAVYAVIPKGLGERLERSCEDPPGLTESEIGQIVLGTKLVLGAGIGEPYSTEVDSVYVYRRLIKIPSNNAANEHQQSSIEMIADHVSLFVDLWQCRDGRVPRHANTKQAAEKLAVSYERKEHAGSTDVPDSASLLQAFCYTHIAGPGYESKPGFRKAEAEKFWDWICGHFCTCEELASRLRRILPVTQDTLNLDAYCAFGPLMRWSDEDRKILCDFFSVIQSRVNQEERGEHPKQPGLLLWGKSSSGKSFLVESAAEASGATWDKDRHKLMLSSADPARIQVWLKDIKDDVEHGDKPVIAFLDEICSPDQNKGYDLVFKVGEMRKTILVCAGSSGDSWDGLCNAIRQHHKGIDLLNQIDRTTKWTIPEARPEDRVIVLASQAAKRGYKSVDRSLMAYVLALDQLDFRSIESALAKVRAPTNANNTLRLQDYAGSEDELQKFLDTYADILKEQNGDVQIHQAKRI